MLERQVPPGTGNEMSGPLPKTPLHLALHLATCQVGRATLLKMSSSCPRLPISILLCILLRSRLCMAYASDWHKTLVLWAWKVGHLNQIILNTFFFISLTIFLSSSPHTAYITERLEWGHRILKYIPEENGMQFFPLAIRKKKVAD